jgi:hypothetical protein
MPFAMRGAFAYSEGHKSTFTRGFQMKAIIRNALLTLAIFAYVHEAKGQVMPVQQSPSQLPAKQVSPYDPGDVDRVAPVPQSTLQPWAKQNTPFGLGDVRLGMSIAEFKVKHPTPKRSDPGAEFHIENNKEVQSLGVGQSDCSLLREGPLPEWAHPELQRVVVGVTACHYYGAFLGVQFGAKLGFVDGKLAWIKVLLPSKMPPAGPAFRRDYPLFLPELVDEIGQPKQFGNAKGWDNLFQAFGLRWENDSSVAEYQDAECYPQKTSGQPDLSKEIAELLEGSYCSVGDQDFPRQPVILYVHKELGRTLMMRLAKTTD